MAGKVKDVAAGAVLVTAITSVVVGVLIFSDYLLKFVQ
jgi:diacylglycerol kinase